VVDPVADFVESLLHDRRPFLQLFAILLVVGVIGFLALRTLTDWSPDRGTMIACVALVASIPFGFMTGTVSRSLFATTDWVYLVDLDARVLDGAVYRMPSADLAEFEVISGQLTDLSPTLYVGKQVDLEARTGQLPNDGHPPGLDRPCGFNPVEVRPARQLAGLHGCRVLARALLLLDERLYPAPEHVEEFHPNARLFWQPVPDGRLPVNRIRIILHERQAGGNRFKSHTSKTLIRPAVQHRPARQLRLRANARLPAFLQRQMQIGDNSFLGGPRPCKGQVENARLRIGLVRGLPTSRRPGLCLRHTDCFRIEVRRHLYRSDLLRTVAQPDG